MDRKAPKCKVVSPHTGHTCRRLKGHEGVEHKHWSRSPDPNNKEKNMYEVWSDAVAQTTP